MPRHTRNRNSSPERPVAARRRCCHKCTCLITYRFRYGVGKKAIQADTVLQVETDSAGPQRIRAWGVAKQKPLKRGIALIMAPCSLSPSALG